MLVAISAMHNRHALSRAWSEHTASLGFDMVCIALTHGDEENARTCGDHGFAWVWADNQPLGNKFNAALRRCSGVSWGIPTLHNSAEEERRWGRHMILPSDDFASPAWVKAAREHEGDYLYPHTCGILDSATQNAYKIRKLGLGSGGQIGTLKFGAGRVISRKVIEKIGGPLWPVNLPKGLDTASHNAIIAAGFRPTVVETEGIPITDVKTAENLWPYNAWIGSGDTITANEALHMCSPSVRAKIDALKT